VPRSNAAASSVPPPVTPPALRDASSSLKGTALRSTIAAIERIHGRRGLAQVKEALSEGARTALDHVLSVSWYPVSLSADLHSAVRYTVGRGSWEASRELGREAAKIDYTGVYRVVLRAVQYDTVFSRMELTWRHYYTRGSLAWDHRRPGFTRLMVRGAEGFNEGMWNACAGRGESLLRLTGARSADVSVLDANEQGCTFEAMWLT
jgi:hypothetical protein